MTAALARRWADRPPQQKVSPRFAEPVHRPERATRAAARCPGRFGGLEAAPSFGEHLVRPFNEPDENRWVGKRGFLPQEIRLKDSTSP